MLKSILTTKLNIPSLRRNIVPRQRLLERLDQGLHRKLTLVSAPAGFGKTTLLGAWVRSLEAGGAPPLKVAWISLDDGDNDPVRFSAYLAAALQRAAAGLEWADGETFEEAGFFLQESQLIALINQVAASPVAFVLVLDDYHWITSQVIHNAVTFLIDHLPENLHLIVATRADPPLPLPRLRARGHLTELRQRDLRFTTDEAAAFLNDVTGSSLSAQDVAALEARTEGWIAGLQMAALSLQGLSSHSAARSAFVQAFTGSHRFVLDYLVEEVLEQQPSAIQEFLLKTSILKQLSRSLCEAVVGGWEFGELGSQCESPTPRLSDSQSILEHLEAANLFIVPLDHERRWYRYHRLFADLLQQRLRRSWPDSLPILHRRASVWHEQHGLVAGAIDHALAAEDFDRATALIEENVEATLMRSEITTFLNWVERLPDEMVRARPTLCFFHAWALLMSGQGLTAVEQRLEDVARAHDAMGESTDAMAGRIAALRAYRMLFYADMDRAVELCRQALAHLPEHDVFLRGVVTWILSLVTLGNKDLQENHQTLKEIIRVSQEMGNLLVTVSTLCHQAKLQARQGHLYHAREIMERALQLATDPQGRRRPIASEALMGLGELAREWNDLETAAEYLTESIALAKQWSELAAFDAYYPLARVRLAQGNVEAAREALETARRIAQESKITIVDDLLIDLQHAHFWVSQGDVEAARHWAEARGLVPGGSPKPHPAPEAPQEFVRDHLRKYEYLVLARLFILQGQAREALDLLAPLLAQARQRGRIDLIIEIHILRALASQVAGHNAEAMADLMEALSLAEPGGYIRIFLDEGEPMTGLLRQAASREIMPPYVAELLTALGEPESIGEGVELAPPQTEPLIEPLSERELEVLRLLATGLSNPEIADELYIAVSTVRSHCKNIYGKLNVHKRWDAVQRGQELGLI